LWLDAKQFHYTISLPYKLFHLLFLSVTKPFEFGYLDKNRSILEGLNNANTMRTNTTNILFSFILLGFVLKLADFLKLVRYEFFIIIISGIIMRENSRR